MKLYLFSPLGEPHTEGPLPGLTECGLNLADAVQITELQAAVYLDDRRCKTCCPHHTLKAGRNG